MSDDVTSNKRKGNGEEPHFVVIDKRPSCDDSGATVPEPRYPSFVEELKARAEEAERRAREISSAYRRIDEERDAFRTRLTRDLERRVDLARADILRKVVSMVDDLERALAAAEEAAEPATLVDGVTLIRDRMLQTLASEGVEAIETVGTVFDPEIAEAVATEEVDDPAKDKIVLEEMEKGYTLRGALLRPARVRVARARQKDDSPK